MPADLDGLLDRQQFADALAPARFAGRQAEAGR